MACIPHCQYFCSLRGEGIREELTGFANGDIAAYGLYSTIKKAFTGMTDEPLWDRREWVFSRVREMLVSNTFSQNGVDSRLEFCRLGCMLGW